MERMPRMEEESLIAKAQQGDRDAMARLLEQYEPMLVSLAKKRCPKASFRDDFRQQARMHFMYAVQRYQQGHGTALISWAHKVVSLLLLKDRMNAPFLIRMPAVCFYAGEKIPKVTAMHNLPGGAFGELPALAVEDAGLSDERLMLRNAIANLPSRLRYIMEQRFEGKTLQQVGDSLECTKENTRLEELRAKKAVARELLGDDAEIPFRSVRKFAHAVDQSS